MLRIAKSISLFVAALTLLSVWFLEPTPWLHAPRTGGVIENRGENYRQYLQASVMIRTNNCSGSGTICHYDRANNTAWVISCAHLFEDNPRAAWIIVFYKNSEKLDRPVAYPARLICSGRSVGTQDISFTTFQPDWEIGKVFPLGRADYTYSPEKIYYSCGCDRAGEVACYLMHIIHIYRGNLILSENLPRYGRSGGGLLSDEGNLVGVCWGSSDPQAKMDSGVGWFVSLRSIHGFVEKNHLDHLVEVVPARRIPILDWYQNRVNQLIAVP